MDYIHYITEENNMEYLDLIFEQCTPILKIYKNINKPVGYYDKFLFRGMKSDETFIKKIIRDNRKPMNSSQSISNLLDNIFNLIFGWRARSNAMFCTGDKNEALSYGECFAIFPIGDFRFIWSPKVKDLYEDFTNDVIKLIIEIKDNKQFLKSFVVDKLEYTNKNLEMAIDSFKEIMLNCKEYYAFNYEIFLDKYYDEFVERMNKI